MPYFCIKFYFNMTNENNNPEQPNIGPDEIRAHVNALLTANRNKKAAKPTGNLFIAKPVNDWMLQASNMPEQKMLFSEFWFEDEVCILFADTNLGKSILAVQIGDSISNGQPIPWFKLQTPPQKVLYFDFELSKKQFESRYRNEAGEQYAFNPHFYRIEINTDAIMPDGQSFEEQLYYSLERTVLEQQAKVLIIDNLTYLRNETEKAKDAAPLMKQLKDLKEKYNLSILVLAHTPKRDLSKPITRNDLSGSKMLINFCDSAFTIGESFKDNNLRYLKQIKQRNGEQVYTGNNVCLCQVAKPDKFLQFELIGCGKESEHLKEQTEKDGTELQRRVFELKQQGLTFRQIAEELGIARSTADRLFRKA